MKLTYRDILERIAEKPTWYDENGVPRYGEFKPDLCPDIYAKRVGLFWIACQSCGTKFKVELSAGLFDRSNNFPPRAWHYGDPPRHDCTGDTMNCDDLAVIEFWIKNSTLDWERAPEFEGVIDAV